MKDEIEGLAIEKFVGLKPKMCSFLVDTIVNIKRQKIWIEIYSKYKYVLLNNNI